MSPLAWSLLTTALISAMSLSGLPLVYLSLRRRQALVGVLVALAAGALLGGALLHMLPEASEGIGALGAGWMALLGFSLFFFTERALRWSHCHKQGCEVHPVAYLNLLGDGVHNFFDGIVIAAAFLAGVGPGLIVGFLVLAHEIPQEIGDLAVLVHAGLRLRAAALLNLSTAVLAVGGTLIGYFALEEALSAIPYVFAISAGGFLYIAASDLIPELHLEKSQVRAWGAFFTFLAGLLLMGGVRWLAERLS
jgi:zinc and cadmium transporter